MQQPAPDLSQSSFASILTRSSVGLCGIRIGIERGGEVLDVAWASQGCGDEVLKEDGEAEGAEFDHAVLLQNGKQVGGTGNGRDVDDAMASRASSAVMRFFLHHRP